MNGDDVSATDSHFNVGDQSTLRYSIVVPVFNEAENIAEFLRRALNELPPDYELLICYDMPEDTTLAALQAVPSTEKPSNIRLIHNQLGRGVRYAIEAGLRAANGPVILVTMVDLSDDLSSVGTMIELAEDGAAVVCGSRYMKGGRQVGGPWLKGLLSRTAGLTLHWFAGLPTHDPTNSFKVYRHDFVERQTIESQAGFSLGLELTVKAHAQGLRVAEVPTTWHDRAAGESRFQLWKWLPLYLEWYVYAFKVHWLGNGIDSDDRTTPGGTSPESGSSLNNRVASGRDSLDDQDREAFLLLAPTVLAIGITSIVAYLAMLIIYFLPHSDPLDTVGVSLMGGFDGYTESGERAAFFTLIGSAVLLSPLAAKWMRRLSNGYRFSMSLVVLWVLLVWFNIRIGPKLVMLAGGMASLLVLKDLVSRLRWNHDKFALEGWILIVLAWGVMQDFYYPTLARLNDTSVFIFLTSAVSLALFRKYRPEAFRQFFPVIATITAVCFIGLAADIFSSRRIAVALCAIVFSKSEAIWKQLRRSIAWVMSTTYRNHLTFWMLMAFLSWNDFFLRKTQNGIQEFYLITTEGLLCGLLLESGHFRRINFRELKGCIESVKDDLQSWTAAHGQALANKRLMRWIVPLMILPAAIFSGWFAICVGLVCAGIAFEWRMRPRMAAGWVLAGGLALACWPTSPYLPNRPLGKHFYPNFKDTFHDGQVMSAIWELERGRPLISEVFPLRSTEVYLGWLGRYFLGHTMRAADFPLVFGMPLIAFGACLIGYAWTRSALWSLVCGLGTVICASSGPLSTGNHFTREGLSLVVMGLGSMNLLCRDQRWWGLLVPLGLVPMFGGYDLAVTYLAAVGTSVMFGTSSRIDLKSIVRGFVLAGLIVGLSVGLFTSLLAVIAGINGSWDYWATFFDYSKYYTAFYGLPVGNRWMPINVCHQYSEVALVWFAAGGVLLWNEMNPQRRRLWLFLLTGSTLTMLRGLGRSDVSHFHPAIIPTFALWSLIYFEVLRRMKRAKWRLSANAFFILTQFVVVALVWQAPFRGTGPVEFVKQLRQFPKTEDVLFSPDPVVAGLVRPDEYLWAGDLGIANIEQQRQNPTRHAIAYCIGSPTEQRRAIRDLESHPTPVVIWNWLGVDDIDGTVRYWIMASQLLRKYRPSSLKLPPYESHYVTPAEPDWPGTDEIDESFLTRYELQRLPYLWGERRWPLLTRRVVQERAFGTWEPVDVERDQFFQPRLVASDEINPREWNYLKIAFTVDKTDDRTKPWTQVRLEFSQSDEFSQFFQVTWECPADGRIHEYLIPIGSNPGWAWKPRIRMLRLSTKIGREIRSVSANVCEIDDLRERD